MNFDSEVVIVMTEKDFHSQYTVYKDMIEEYLDEISRIKECPQQRVKEAERYSLLAGGKRIRPVFSLCFAQMFGVRIEEILPFAAAVEMIHTYSLIHDDLPAMDNDDLRRGKPTNHKVYGEAVAILAGDALLTGAFDLIHKAMLNVSEEKVKYFLKAAEILSAAAGDNGMIAGQVVDMEAEGREISAEQLRFMHLNKTGALIKASCLMPVVISGISSEDDIYGQIEKFAEYIGLIFQMKDDILDVESSEDVLGKPIGSDCRQSKSTFVTVYGVEECRRLAEEYTQRAIEIVGKYNNSQFIIEFSEYLLKRIN